MNELQLLTPAEVAKLLGVHRTTVWRYVNAGTLPPPIKIGAQATRFRATDVAAFIERISQAAA